MRVIRKTLTLTKMEPWLWPFPDRDQTSDDEDQDHQVTDGKLNATYGSRREGIQVKGHLEETHDEQRHCHDRSGQDNQDNEEEYLDKFIKFTENSNSQQRDETADTDNNTDHSLPPRI